MQLYVMRDGWGELQFFLQLRPNGALTRGCSAAGFRAINLQSCGQLQSNGTPRRRVASAQRRWVVLSTQLRPNDIVPLRRCNSVSSNQVRFRSVCCD